MAIPIAVGSQFFLCFDEIHLEGSFQQMPEMSYSIVSAVNDCCVMDSCLLASPDVTSSIELLLQRGFPSAAVAYNQALDQSTKEVIVFVHQDVFLPPGWRQSFTAALRWLEQNEPQWGVLGLYGVTGDGRPTGWVYSAGLRHLLGGPFPAPELVRTLDEVLLVVRKSSGIRFDESLPGFHMYGTDICLEAERLGMRNYVVPCFAVHNSNGIKNLPVAFWKAYLHVRRKWRACLPIYAPCAVVTRSFLPPASQIFWRTLRYSLGRRTTGRRVADPVALYRQLEEQGAIPKGNYTGS